MSEKPTDYRAILAVVLLVAAAPLVLYGLWLRPAGNLNDGWFWVTLGLLLLPIADLVIGHGKRKEVKPA